MILIITYFTQEELRIYTPGIKDAGLTVLGLGEGYINNPSYMIFTRVTG